MFLYQLVERQRRTKHSLQVLKYKDLFIKIEREHVQCGGEGHRISIYWCNGKLVAIISEAFI